METFPRQDLVTQSLQSRKIKLCYSVELLETPVNIRWPVRHICSTSWTKHGKSY